MIAQADLDISIEMQQTADEHIRKALEMEGRNIYVEILFAIERRVSSMSYLGHLVIADQFGPKEKKPKKDKKGGDS